MYLVGNAGPITKGRPRDMLDRDNRVLAGENQMGDFEFDLRGRGRNSKAYVVRYVCIFGELRPPLELRE